MWVFRLFTGELRSIRLSDEGSGDGGFEAGRCLAATPDGRFVVARRGSGTIEVWDLETGRLDRTLEGLGGKALCIDLSADGRWLAIGVEKTLQVWDLEWDYEFPVSVEWDERARPVLEAFVRRQGILNRGVSTWTEEDVGLLLRELRVRGLGWIRPAGVRRTLEKMAAPG